jgi:hypothetical protein
MVTEGDSDEVRFRTSFRSNWNRNVDAFDPATFLFESVAHLPAHYSQRHKKRRSLLCRKEAVRDQAGGKLLAVSYFNNFWNSGLGQFEYRPQEGNPRCIFFSQRVSTLPWHFRGIPIVACIITNHSPQLFFSTLCC